MDNTISLNEREKLLQQIDYLREPLRQLTLLIPQHEKASADLERIKKYFSYKKKHNPYPNCIFSSFCIIFGLPILNFILGWCLYSFEGAVKQFQSFPISWTFILITIFIVVSTVWIIISYFSRKSELARLSNKIQNKNDELSSINKSLYDIVSTIKNDITVLPPDYQYSMAAEYIYSCLRNQRANTIGEAVNLYEDQLHKWRVENSLQQLNQMQKEQAASLRYIKATSGIAAAASVAGLFL